MLFKSLYGPKILVVQQVLAMKAFLSYKYVIDSRWWYTVGKAGILEFLIEICLSFLCFIWKQFANYIIISDSLAIVPIACLIKKII